MSWNVRESGCVLYTRYSMESDGGMYASVCLQDSHNRLVVQNLWFVRVSSLVARYFLLCLNKGFTQQVSCSEFCKSELPCGFVFL